MTLHMLNYLFQSFKIGFDQFEISMIFKNFLSNFYPFAEPSPILSMLEFHSSTCLLERYDVKPELMLTNSQQCSAEVFSIREHSCLVSLSSGTVLDKMFCLKRVCRSSRQLQIATFFKHEYVFIGLF